MLGIIKKSVMALIATVSLPHAANGPVAKSSEPSAVSRVEASEAAPPARPSVAEQSSADSAPRQKILAQEVRTNSSRSAPVLPAKLPLEMGDNLKVTFYETIDTGSDAENDAQSQGGLRTFYQRTDVSGEYVVEQDGVVSIPLLGRFPAEGRTPEDIRSDLATSFATVTGRSANVDVRIIERSPIYVVGPVKKPGAYKYAPGMIVLQAVALAGGLDRGEENTSGMVEGVREIGRLRISTVRYEQLLAQRARLEAESDGLPALSIADSELSALLGNEAESSAWPVSLAKLDAERTAATFIKTESRILHAEQAKRQEQNHERELKTAAARIAVTMLKQKLDQYNIERDLRFERLDAMQKLKDHGVVTSNNMMLLRTELAEIEARRQDAFVAVADAEARLAEAEGDSERQSAENATQLSKEIEAVDKEIAEAREATISARESTAILLRPVSAGLQEETYTIVRQSKDGAATVEASEASQLIPGDVLKVSLGNSNAARPISFAAASHVSHGRVLVAAPAAGDGQSRNDQYSGPDNLAPVGNQPGNDGAREGSLAQRIEAEQNLSVVGIEAKP
jgi:polysaccharide biosynthesis/export protein ExoF